MMSMAALAATAVSPAEGMPAVTNIPEAVYPCVDSLSKATFRVYAPEARDVKIDICGLAGDICVARTLEDGRRLYPDISWRLLKPFSPTL